MSNNLIQIAGVHLNATASSPEEAVRLCGQKLLELEAVDQKYVDAMWEREQAFSSAIGFGLAIPHGTDQARAWVKFDQLVFLRFGEPIDWQGDEVKMCVGIAAQGDNHMDILGNLADLIQDPESEKTLLETNDPQEILNLVLATESE
ncbi:MAG: PTS sugar transporter subunit IIA [Microbacteriaceae bacterium]|nr:PTS sugar transporter subunit IIA [Microbacteriaceae bacterium]MDR9444425.1 PTS sugar transporter subunit IIA [Microbacteriaceae bacterium]